MKKDISKRNTLDSNIHDNFLGMNKQLTRRDATSLDSGYHDTETWGGLLKCWTGFKIAKVDGNTKKMEYYTKGTRKFQRELKISVSINQSIKQSIPKICTVRSKDARRTRFRKRPPGREAV